MEQHEHRVDETLSSAPAALDKVEIAQLHPDPKSYPPISSIPTTSIERRLQSAAAAAADDDDDGDDAPRETGKSAAAGTVLYLAYGSNMAAQTFLGSRKIRPLSQVNVSVPTMRLTFNLPGFPYKEPCFANVAYKRQHQENIKRYSDEQTSLIADEGKDEDDDDVALVGVVYEVTEQDWGQILRTEGGGASYKEIEVPCFAISSKTGAESESQSSSTSSSPPSSKPFFARTLHAPYITSPHNPSKQTWWQRFTAGLNRPGTSQPSVRYLNILKDGAREHNLPHSYQQYLASFQPYTITSTRQKIGQILFMCAWAPGLLSFIALSHVLAGKDGKLPKGIAGLSNVLFTMMWVSYDVFLEPVFGSGERTEGTGLRRKNKLMDCVMMGQDAV